MKRLLIWDSPNMDMTLGSRLGHRPSPDERPDFPTLLEWLRKDLGSLTLLPCVFANVPTDPEKSQGVQGWVRHLVSTGFRVFVKPRDNGSDIDEEMVAEIELHHNNGDLGHLVLASHDAKRFEELIIRLIAEDVMVTILGWSHDAGSLRNINGAMFINLDEIPGLFKISIPRSNVLLENLPPEGCWFVPPAYLR